MEYHIYFQWEGELYKSLRRKPWLTVYRRRQVRVRGMTSWTPKISGPRHNFSEVFGFVLEGSQFILALNSFP